MDLDRIIYPEERFLEYRDYLIDLISTSYYKGSKDLISKRINDALYFFDSIPNDAYKALKNIGFNPKENKELINYYFLNKDYHLRTKEIKSTALKEYYSYLRDVLKINKKTFNKNKNAILGLNFEMFSKDMKNLINNPSVDQEMRNTLAILQQDYLDSCEELGLSPLVDEKKINELFNFIERQGDYTEQQIINVTLFGKNLLEKMNELKGISLYKKLSIASKAIFIEDENYAVTSSFKLTNDIDNNITTLSMPILKIMSCKGLDIILLHELIHVSEITKKSNCIIGDVNYTMFNEFRTQAKARDLFVKLRKDNIHIFDQDDNDDTLYKSNYDYFLPLISPLLEDYQYLFDYSALSNKLSLLYKNFGRENFIDYCKYLTKVYQLATSSDIIVTEDMLNIDFCYQQIERMKSYTKKKNIK